jgi:hypothetical protein
MKNFPFALALAGCLCAATVLSADVNTFSGAVHRASSRKAPAIDTRTLTSFADDLDALKSELSLSDEQVKKMQEIRDQREKALEKWNASNENKIEKIEDRLSKLPAPKPKGKKGDDKKGDRRSRQVAAARNQLEAALDSLYMARYRLAMGFEKKLWLVLEPDQRGTYNGSRLETAVLGEFGLIALEDKQSDAVKTLCRNAGKRMPMPYQEATGAAMVTGLQKQVYLRVLNKEQKKQYAKSKQKDSDPKDKKKGKNKKDRDDD